MILTPRSVGGSRLKPTLEIIPENRFIVFHGNEHEAESVKLRGIVRLHTPESIPICKPKLRLEGKRKIGWSFAGGASVGEVSNKKVFWDEEHNLGSVEAVHKVKAGTIEWPFEYDLSPSMPESVEGLKETFIVYHLHASVSRPGWNTKDIVAQEHIRIVRTLGQEAMETSRSRANADIWPNKISYNISIPTDAVVFGTCITADVELSPIRKGIRLGKIQLHLIEMVVKRIQSSEAPDIRRDKTKGEESEVANTDMEFPEHSKVMHLDETADSPIMEDEMYRFKATLPLPKSLNVCRQDVDSHEINVTHRFKLMVNIHNPEGHVSQLVCRLPVKLFISPNLPVDESNEVCPATNGLSDAELNQQETRVDGPPQYGHHILDQMYSEIDPSGYMSRAGSGSNTPFLAQSRRASSENLASLNGVADADAEGTEQHGSATPSILHSRLADLQERGSSHAARTSWIVASHNASGAHTPHNEEQHGHTSLQHNNVGSHFGFAGRSPHTSTPHSRRGSDEADASADVHRTDYDIDNLCRVPSYGAAIRTPGAVTPFTDGPPSYVDATYKASSLIQQPRAAHLMSGASAPNSHSNQTSPTNSLASTSICRSSLAPDAPPPSHSRLAHRGGDA